MPARKPPLSLRKRAIIVGLILGGIVVAHIGLWRSDMPQGEKLMWTIFNSVSWTVILAPIFLIDQMISICEFEGIPYQMSPDLIDRAWANMFVKEEEIIH